MLLYKNAILQDVFLYLMLMVRIEMLYYKDVVEWGNTLYDEYKKISL